MDKYFRGWQMLAAAMLALGALGTVAYAQQEFQRDENGEVRITEETPYVQSPKVVVDTMLEMAGVHANDFLIDLGSGDGRIIISAAKERKARGFGVDYDERLVKLANANAAKAGVADRASFFEQNVFTTDLGSATVVTMYLLPEYNAKLAPRLLALRPGTRIVSHDYGIDDWQPDAKKKIPVPGKPVGFEKASDILFWVVPAKVAGHWRSSVPSGAGPAELHLMINQKYQHFTGTANIAGREVPIERPFLKADHVSFRIQDGKDSMVFTGRVTNSRISGEMRLNGKSSRWNALRTEEMPPHKTS